ncbi:hypothetical protein Btru_057721 [Bulinus truncatus]|nr:hypothetical protein Btru_057721 [Bulinus truncatus]
MWTRSKVRTVLVRTDEKVSGLHAGCAKRNTNGGLKDTALSYVTRGNEDRDPRRSNGGRKAVQSPFGAPRKDNNDDRKQRRHDWSMPKASTNRTSSPTEKFGKPSLLAAHQGWNGFFILGSSLWWVSNSRWIRFGSGFAGSNLGVGKQREPSPRCDAGLPPATVTPSIVVMLLPAVGGTEIMSGNEISPIKKASQVVFVCDGYSLALRNWVFTSHSCIQDDKGPLVH